MESENQANQPAHEIPQLSIFAWLAFSVLPRNELALEDLCL